jgi:hypothetical protein
MLEDGAKGSSLLIMHVDKFELLSKVTKVPLQVSMDEYTEGTGKLGDPISEIKLTSQSKNDVTYTVMQFSPTLKDEIRFYLNGLKDFTYGYQKKAIFPVIYRKNDSKLFLFTNIYHTNIFLKRITELKRSVSIKEAHFDFEDFTAIPEIKNIWGAWERVNLPHKKTNASFGNQVNESVDVKLSRATAVNLKMEINHKNIQSIYIKRW